MGYTCADKSRLPVATACYEFGLKKACLLGKQKKGQARKACPLHRVNH